MTVPLSFGESPVTSFHQNANVVRALFRKNGTREMWSGKALAIGSLLVVSVAAIALLLREEPRTITRDATPSQRVRPAAPNIHAANDRSSPRTDATTSDLPWMFDVELAKEWRALDDSTTDGWKSEAFAQQVQTQLKKLGDMLTNSADLAAANLSEIATEDFVGGPLVPADLELIFQDDAVQIHRKNLPDRASDTASRSSGPLGLNESLVQLARQFSEGNNLRIKFKVYHVDLDGNKATSRQLVEISGRLQTGILEHHAHWDALWILAADALPKLASLDVAKFEQARTKAAVGTLFDDCTYAVLANNECYEQQFMKGFAYWRSLARQSRYFANLGNPGLAVGDVNGDGLDDLYVCQEQGLPNRLFIQRANGTAAEVSKTWEVDWLQDSRSALLLDLDNDKDQDLIVAFLGGILVASNEDDGRFRIRTVVATSEDLMSLCAADFDNDGDLDIYSTAYYADQFVEHATTGSLPTATENIVYHDANLGGRNVLLRNDISGESWDFVDVTKQTALEANNTRFSLAAAWEDFDNDGDQDLYVANDFGRDNLYRNDGGRFVDIGERAGAEDSASGMSVSWGDYDRNGTQDAYVANMWSAAGSRITYQPKFKDGAPANIKRRLQRFSRGNTLLQNENFQTFRDVSGEAGVDIGRWAWSSQFVDLNNDGWEDVLVTNGYITGDDKGGDL